jgi:hypothetical protein
MPNAKDELPAFLVLLMVIMIGRLAFAQSAPALLVVPSKATMLVGDTRTFRAVGKDGRKQQNVTWNVSPEHAATLTAADAEATLQASEPSVTVVLTAHAGTDSAEASIEIRSGTALPTGTALWSVSHLPGCTTTKMSQAVPSANGPDIYDEEACPDGTVIRAMTADGREIWRRRLGDLAAVPSRPTLPTNEKTRSADRLNLSAHSFCDDVSPGMTRDVVSKLAQNRNLRVDEKERESGSWMIEERNFQCKIVFNEIGTVAKKTKIIVTD